MKPAWKTWAFWVKVLVAAGGFVLTSGALTEGSVIAQIVGGAMTLLGGATAGAQLKAAPTAVEKFPPGEG